MTRVISNYSRTSGFAIGWFALTFLSLLLSPALLAQTASTGAIRGHRHRFIECRGS